LRDWSARLPARPAPQANGDCSPDIHLDDFTVSPLPGITHLRAAEVANFHRRRAAMPTKILAEQRHQRMVIIDRSRKLSAAASAAPVKQGEISSM